MWLKPIVYEKCHLAQNVFQNYIPNGFGPQ